MRGSFIPTFRSIASIMTKSSSGKALNIISIKKYDMKYTSTPNKKKYVLNRPNNLNT